MKEVAMFQMASAEDADRLSMFLAACDDVFSWRDGEAGLAIEIHA